MNIKVNLETHLIAPALRDKVHRVDHEQLLSNVPTSRLLTETSLSEMVSAISDTGMFSPILLDSHGYVIAGDIIVAAAQELVTDDIPAIYIADLTKEELVIFIDSTMYFYRVAGLSLEMFLAETLYIRELTDQNGYTILDRAGFANAVAA